MALSAGNEGHLWGGSGPRTSYVWCARALVILGAQLWQCCPHCFWRGQLFRRQHLFGGDSCFKGAVVARQVGNDLGVVNGP